MTPSPVTPADFQSTVPSVSASLCGKFQAVLLKLPAILSQYFGWQLNADGSLSGDFLRQIIPSGFIMHSATLLGASTDWLLCDGSEVSQTTYPDLYVAIGAAFGTASTGNFKLPDCRAKFIMGVGTLPSTAVVALGGTGGNETYTLTSAEVQLPAHFHYDGMAVDPAQTNDTWYQPGDIAVPPDNTNTPTIRVVGSSGAVGAAQTSTAGIDTTATPNAAFSLLNPYIGLYSYIKT